MRRFWAPALAGLLVTAGCLKSLDESQIRDDDSTGGAGGTSSGGTGGSGGGAAGLGGSSGSGGGAAGSGGVGNASGSGGTAGTGGAAGSGGRPPVVFTPWDNATHPVENVAGAPAPILLSTDGSSTPNYVYRTVLDATTALVFRNDLSTKSGSPVYNELTPITRPQAMASPPVNLFLFLVGREPATAVGRIFRVPKGGGGPLVTLTTTNMESGVGIFAGDQTVDPYAYVSARAYSAGNPSILRFRMAVDETAAEPIYASEGNETGGDITVAGDCIYWISEKTVWTLPKDGAPSRTPALQTPVNDAVGITSDAANFYYTRNNGEVWQRKLFGPGCDGSGPPEQVIAWGYEDKTFDGIGDVIVYDDTVAWAVKGDPLNDYAGGGVFSTTVGGHDIVQIAPYNGGPTDIDQTDTHVVYATAAVTGSNAIIKMVAK